MVQNVNEPSHVDSTRQINMIIFLPISQHQKGPSLYTWRAHAPTKGNQSGHTLHVGRNMICFKLRTV